MNQSQTIEDILTFFDIKDIHSGSAYGNVWLSQEYNNEILESFSPNNQEKLGTVYQTTSAQMNEILTRSHNAFLIWRSVPAPKRGELIRLLGDKLREYKAQLGALVSMEMGKSLQEGYGEVQEMIDMAEFAVGQSRMLYGNTMHSERELHRMYEQWHPLGVVGVISAFNFPVAVWAWNAFLGVICGNTIVWKPSFKTPLCSIVVHKICAEVLKTHNYPAVFSLITTNDINLSKAFVDDKRIPLVSFTGSTEVGREVGVRLSKRFAKSLLELGGNNAVILDESVDLNIAIPSLVFAAIGTAGQRCTTLRRLIIHEKIYNEVIQKMTEIYQQLKIGNSLDEANHMGALIDEMAVKNYLYAIEQSKLSNGKILSGGNVLAKDGFFVEPTIIEIDPNAEIVNIETFAPILYVFPYKTLQDAIKINNQVQYGLSSAIYTNNIFTMEEFLSHRGSDCGIANVNIGTSGAEIGGAFGGEKATGGGREAGSDAWKSYMRRQTTTINYGTKLTLAQGIKFSIEER